MGKLLDKFVGMIGDLLASLFGWLMAPFKDINSITDLVYGKIKGENTIYGIFSQTDIDKIYTPGSTVFTVLAGSIILLGVVLWGVKLSTVSFNPNARTEALGTIKDLIIVTFAIINLPVLYDMLFSLNHTVVSYFGSLIGKKEGASFALKVTNDDGDILGIIIINLLLLFLSLWANFYYMMRRLTLLLLMIMGPLMIAFYLIPKTKGIAGAWLKELVGTVFVQFIHAALFWMILLMSKNTDTDTVKGLIETVILYMVFIPLGEMVRSMIGLGGNMTTGLARAGAMSGLSGLANLYGAVKGGVSEAKSLIGEEKTDGMNRKSDNEEASKGVGNNIATDKSTTPKGEKMLKAGSWASVGGRAVMGMAGAVGGSALGPVGSIVAGTVGRNVGGAVGGVAGRVGAAGVQGIADRVGKFKNAFNETMNPEPTGKFEDVANQIADSQTTQWAKGQEAEFKKDFLEKFPNGNAEAAWQENKAQKREGFLNEARQNIATATGGVGSFAKASSLVNPMAQSMASQWGESNKGSIMSEYNQNNPLSPTATAEEKAVHQANGLQHFESTVANKAKDIMGIGLGVAKDMTGTGKGFVNSEQFAQSFAQKAGTSLPNTDVQSISSGALQATRGIASSLISSENGQTGISTGVLASQMAHTDATNARENYISSLGAGVKSEAAEQQWQTTGYNEAFKESFARHSDSLPDAATIPLAQSPSNFTPMKVTGAVATGIAAATGISSIPKAFPTVQAMVGGFAHGLATDKNLTGAVQYASAGIDSVTTNPIEAQQDFRNMASYAGGMAFGVGGYQAAASMAMKVNPYNGAVEKSILNAGQIASRVMTSTNSNGVQQVDPGALQMVRTQDQTYIQMKNTNGEYETVSRLAPGDSMLEKGQTLYQNLTISNGQITTDPSSRNAFQYDSSGMKVDTGRTINADYNKLLAGYGSNFQNYQPQPVTAFNERVDSGQFYKPEIVSNVSSGAITEMKMIVQHEQSFIQGMVNNEAVRLSPYYSGNANIQQGETYMSDLSMDASGHLAMLGKLKNNDKELSSTFNPNDYIPITPNPRLQQRSRIDMHRVREGVKGAMN